MAHAGGREGGGEVAIDALPKPDEDACRKPGLGLGESGHQRITAEVAQALHRDAGCGGHDLHRPRVERA